MRVFFGLIVACFVGGSYGFSGVSKETGVIGAEFIYLVCPMVQEREC